eukprot:1146329-Pelagomonas_calceolata.AAC.4
MHLSALPSPLHIFRDRHLPSIVQQKALHSLGCLLIKGRSLKDTHQRALTQQWCLLIKGQSSKGNHQRTLIKWQ